jgi:hypothetical protein
MLRNSLLTGRALVFALAGLLAVSVPRWQKNPHGWVGRAGAALIFQIYRFVRL